MGLRKSHVKKGNPRVFNLGLFGIIDNTESADQMRNNEASFLVTLNFKARKSVRNAIIEAEYRKAQAIALARQIRYM